MRHGSKWAAVAAWLLVCTLAMPAAAAGFVDGAATPADTNGLQNPAWMLAAGELVPDLTVSWQTVVSHDLTRRIGGTLLVTNIGRYEAKPFVVRVYLSRKGSRLDQLIREYPVEDNLKPSESVTVDFKYSHRMELAGQHLIAVVDEENVIEETSESNNRATVQIPDRRKDKDELQQ